MFIKAEKLYALQQSGEWQTEWHAYYNEHWIGWIDESEDNPGLYELHHRAELEMSTPIATVLPDDEIEVKITLSTQLVQIILDEIPVDSDTTRKLVSILYALQ